MVIGVGALIVIGASLGMVVGSFWDKSSTYFYLGAFLFLATLLGSALLLPPPVR